MAILAPWNGRWLRRATPIVLTLVVLVTVAVFVIGIIAATTINRLPDSSEHRPSSPAAAYAQGHQLLVRAELIFFYCTIPAVMVATTTTEYFCFWTNALRPLYVITVSAVACCLWIMQITLWSVCESSISRQPAPDYCPVAFKGDIGHAVNLSGLQVAFGASFAGVALLLIYLAYLALGVVALRRENRELYRIPERKWIEKATSVRTRSSHSSSGLESLPDSTGLSSLHEGPTIFDRSQVPLLQVEGKPCV